MSRWWLAGLLVVVGCGPRGAARSFGSLSSFEQRPTDIVPFASGDGFVRLALGNGKRLTPTNNLEWDESCVIEGQEGVQATTHRGDYARFDLSYPGVGPALREGDEIRYYTRADAAVVSVCDVRIALVGYDDGSGIPAPDDVASPPSDATVTASGLAYRVLEEGSGDERPTKTTKVKVHYTGWTTDGRMFDSSVERGVPAEFPLNRVISGWTEGLALMAKGEKTRFWIPQNLAYKGQVGKPEGMLVFDVELLDFTLPLVWDRPTTWVGHPAEAEVTASGIASLVLEPGDPDAVRPTAASTVTVHYVGYTTDGKQIDSSLDRGQPATFPLDGVIEGWTEGVALMQVGEKRRFWIPQELAYKGRPGTPQGNLIFDIKLLDVQ